MRKQTSSSGSQAVSRSGDAWLDLERLAKVEITSESAEHPIESALIPDRLAGERRNPENRRSASSLTNPLPSGVFFSGETKRNRAHAEICAAVVTGRTAVAARDRAPAV